MLGAGRTHDLTAARTRKIIRVTRWLQTSRRHHGDAVRAAGEQRCDVIGAAEGSLSHGAPGHPGDVGGEQGVGQAEQPNGKVIRKG